MGMETLHKIIASEDEIEETLLYHLHNFPKETLFAAQAYGESDIDRPHIEGPPITEMFRKHLGEWTRESPRNADLAKSVLSRDVMRHFGIATY